MIDMTDIPASWAGRQIRVYRTGMELTGMVGSIQVDVEIDTLTRLGDGTPAHQRVTREIDVTLHALEGQLEFRDIRPGNYNIDLIEEN
jgi:hypothetical protein